MGLTEAMEEIFGDISGRIQKVCSGEYSAVKLGGNFSYLDSMGCIDYLYGRCSSPLEG